jgi:hypothetical protein
MKRKSVIIWLTALFASFVIISCANDGAETKLEEIIILQQGMSTSTTDADFVQMCKEFNLRKADVNVFFTKAKKITRAILHDEYDLYPCYSEGTVILNNKKVNWQIHAGGIGFIKSDNTEQVYVCSEKQCKSIAGLF